MSRLKDPYKGRSHPPRYPMRSTLEPMAKTWNIEGELWLESEGPRPVEQWNYCYEQGGERVSPVFLADSESEARRKCELWCSGGVGRSAPYWPKKRY